MNINYYVYSNINREKYIDNKTIIYLKICKNKENKTTYLLKRCEKEYIHT